MMKIIYIANARIPTEKAHGYQIVKMCEEFKFTGNDVELWLPKIYNEIREGLADYYRLKNDIRVRRFFIIVFVWLEKIIKTGIWFVLQSWSFYFRIFFSHIPKEAIIYTRSSELASLLSRKKLRVVVEIHDLNKKRFDAQVNNLKKAYRIITITRGLKNKLVGSGIDEKNILVSPDAVDLKKFDVDLSCEKARKKIGLPQDKQIILYTGHLYDWKGTHTLAEAAKELSDDYRVVFVGGTDKDIETFKKQYHDIDNVMIVGRVEHDKIPIWLKAADILVLPNSGKTDISTYYTSPLKLFEYMAVGRPIIASDLPSIREILSEDNAVFFEADNPVDLAKKMSTLDENKKKELSTNAAKLSKEYTWKKRAKGIIEFIV